MAQQAEAAKPVAPEQKIPMEQAANQVGQHLNGSNNSAGFEGAVQQEIMEVEDTIGEWKADPEPVASFQQAPATNAPRNLSRCGRLRSNQKLSQHLLLRPRSKNLRHLCRSPTSRAPGRRWRSRALALEQQPSHPQPLEADNQQLGLARARRELLSPRASHIGTSELAAREGRRPVPLLLLEAEVHQWPDLRGSPRRKRWAGTAS